MPGSWSFRRSQPVKVVRQRFGVLADINEAHRLSRRFVGRSNVSFRTTAHMCLKTLDNRQQIRRNSSRIPLPNAIAFVKSVIVRHITGTVKSKQLLVARIGNGMGAQQPGKDEKKLKASAHVCSQCGYHINLKDLGLRGTATGLVPVPNAIGRGQ